MQNICYIFHSFDHSQIVSAPYEENITRGHGVLFFLKRYKLNNSRNKSLPCKSVNEHFNHEKGLMNFAVEPKSDNKIFRHGVR